MTTERKVRWVAVVRPWSARSDRTSSRVPSKKRNVFLCVLLGDTDDDDDDDDKKGTNTSMNDTTTSITTDPTTATYTVTKKRVPPCIACQTCCEGKPPKIHPCPFDDDDDDDDDFGTFLAT
eukprot:scaffold9371_cov211-Amphora_coffeaeformis.AAC.15